MLLGGYNKFLIIKIIIVKIGLHKSSFCVFSSKRMHIETFATFFCSSYNSYPFPYTHAGTLSNNKNFVLTFYSYLNHKGSTSVPQFISSMPINTNISSVTLIFYNYTVDKKVAQLFSYLMHTHSHISQLVFLFIFNQKKFEASI